MTLGHVILGADRDMLTALRRHEHVHVAQCERWGPLFLPAYAASSLWQLVRGGCAYRDNHFERQAYARDGSEAQGAEQLQGRRTLAPTAPLRKYR